VDCTKADWAGQVRESCGGRGVDVLLEASGGGSLAEGLRALAPFGRAVVYGAASGTDASLDAATVRSVFYDPAPNQSLVAFNLGGWFIERADAAGTALGEVIGLLAAGVVVAPTIQALPLQQAAQAHRLLEARQGVGKLVLKPWAE
jgi:NADPH:quinone reductase